MIRSICITVAAFASLLSCFAFPASALAQTTPVLCGIMAPELIDDAASLRKVVDAIAATDRIAAIMTFDGAPKKALERVNAARLKLLPLFENYVTALKEAGITMRACALADS